MSHKNANACGDKASQCQRVGLDCLTIWGPEDGSKSEVDPRGADCAKCCREDLVDECLEAKLDPRCCLNLVNKFNENNRKPKAARKNSRIVDRFAIHTPAQNVQGLRYRLPAFATLVSFHNL